jgi:hypothetical protein
MRYYVDVKAFMKVVVEADTPAEAERVAKDFFERMWSSEMEPTPGVIDYGVLDTEDPAYIEDENGDEVQA